MKTIAKAGFLIIAWMAAGMSASAQWNVITEPLPPRQPAPGLRTPPPPPPHHPQRETPRRWMPPREPGRDSVRRPPPQHTQRTQLPPPRPEPRREPVVVRPLGSQQPERRPNPPRRRPDQRDVDRQIQEQDAYGYTYDYGGRGGPPAGHYDLRGDRYDGRYDEMRRERDRRDEERREPPRREVRYPKGAVVLATLNAGGEAKEVVVNRQITRCYLELVSGTVSINTVVVRPEKTALPQTVRLQEGKLHMIDLGGKRAVSGFRISDNGRGVYRVIVQ